MSTETKDQAQPPWSPADGYAVGDSVLATTHMHNGLSDDGMGGYDARPGDVLKVVGFPDGPSIWDLRVEDAHGHRFLCATHEVKPHHAPTLKKHLKVGAFVCRACGSEWPSEWDHCPACLWSPNTK